MIVREPWRPEVPEEIGALFAEEDLHLVGVAPADPAPEESREYQRWLAEGYHGSMSFMERHGAGKFDPGKIVPGAQSILFVGLNYYQKAKRSEDDGIPRGRIARYAWGRDYHKELGNRLRRVARRLQERYPDDTFRGFTDATPLSERYYGSKSGIGFTGRNTLLINGELGSWFFLGEIVTTRRFDRGEDAGDRHGRCPRGCARCIDVCPTGALLGPYRIDARKCISYLTIEHKGTIPEELRPKMGAWIFGCDLCQEVCPLNVRAQETTVPAFRKPIAGDSVLLKTLLRIRGHEEFVERFGGSPLMRPGWKLMIRNAAIAAANLKAEELLPDLRMCLEIDDPVVREHVQWAIDTLLGDR